MKPFFMDANSSCTGALMLPQSITKTPVKLASCLEQIFASSPNWESSGGSIFRDSSKKKDRQFRGMAVIKSAILSVQTHGSS